MTKKFLSLPLYDNVLWIFIWRHEPKPWKNKFYFCVHFYLENNTDNQIMYVEDWMFDGCIIFNSSIVYSSLMFVANNHHQKLCLNVCVTFFVIHKISVIVCECCYNKCLGGYILFRNSYSTFMDSNALLASVLYLLHLISFSIGILFHQC